MLLACSTPPNYSNRSSGVVDENAVIFPHPPNYAENGLHAQNLLAPGRLEACFSCHDESKASGEVKSCFACHENIAVHESGATFKDPSKHGPVAIQNIYRKSCTPCHGATLEGGKNAPTCYGSACHSTESGFPHMSDTMSDGTTHGPILFAKGLSRCLSCHDNGMGVTGKKTCFDCHDRSWVHNRATYGDGAIHRVDAIAKGPMKYCLKCHGSDLYGGKSGKSCYGSGCHDYNTTRYPHNVPNWGDGESVHGPIAHQVGEALCLQCHSVQAAAQKGIKSCESCHD
jgi:hypothetical protein